MRITLDIDKSLEENAGVYFNKAKKLKKKLKGAEAALEETYRKIDKLKAKKDVKKEKRIMKKEWYEKFRWFHSSEGFLVIGGRDATTNEIVIKKHTDPDDLVFHTDLAGSPFVVVKGKNPGEQTINEAAEFCASCSRAWNMKMSYVEVYWVKPTQVSKQARAGEYLVKGAFMIYGKRNYLRARINFALGARDSMIVSGPVSAVRSLTRDFVELVQGDTKKSDIARLLRKRLGGDLDEIMRMMPPGDCSVKG